MKLFFKLLLFACSIVNSHICVSQGTDTATNLVQFCSGLHGFNLLGKFDVSWNNNGYSEKEFSLIQQMGFNYVRLPIDYRTYTNTDDWNDFTETQLQEIDKAVEWGSKYNVHVCINLHRAPGYCVNNVTLPVNQRLNLWKDTVAQTAFVDHWKMFATRYKNITTDRLSFNLVNEPSNVTENEYVTVMKKAIDAIHVIHPERIIFVDGLDYGRNLIPALKNEKNVAQAIHCYDPFGLTHYKAEWVGSSADMPAPNWPLLQISNYLYGDGKNEFKTAMVIEGNFPKRTEITVNVRQVSTEATLLVKAGTETVLSKKFVCSAELGSDFTKIVSTPWGYQNLSNKDFTTKTTNDATKFSFENSAGDWMIINSITIKYNGKTHTYYLSDNTWGKKQETYIADGNGNLKAANGRELIPFEIYHKNIQVAKDNNIAFMVQEFGVYNKTPHHVTVAFLSDLVKLLKKNNIGYALWNFTGSFGILNSDRADYKYETFQGYQLDRQLYNVLKPD